MLAKLPICNPWFAFSVGLERERIDEDRAPLIDLDVVGTRILERHAEVQRDPLDL